MTSGEHNPGEPLAPDDPEVLAFRALRGADEVAPPDTPLHDEKMIQGIADLAPTPEVAAKAITAAVRQERARMSSEEINISIMQKSGRITKEEAERLKDGTADDALRERVAKAIARLEAIKRKRPRGARLGPGAD